MSEFLKRAAILGHNASELADKGSVESVLRFNTLDEYREFTQNLHAHDVEQLGKEFMSNPLAAQPSGLHDRVHRHILANAPLEPGDKEQIEAAHFPLAVEAVSVATSKTLPRGETLIGPNGSPTVWNYETLNIPADSYITVQSTPFTLTVTNLVMQYVHP